MELNAKKLDSGTHFCQKTAIVYERAPVMDTNSPSFRKPPTHTEKNLSELNFIKLCIYKYCRTQHDRRSFYSSCTSSPKLLMFEIHFFCYG